MAENQTDIFTVIEENIRLFAKRKGISLNDLINSIDMTEGGFYKMVKSDTMKVKTLKKIAEALDQPINVFFEGAKTYQKIKGDNNVQASHSMVLEPEVNYKLSALEKQVVQLENQLKDKEHIIELLSKKA